nr:reverse transcriptase domain, reverse transcriptase zinc-binding domain protein [Tanacetum cinerariifolium]
ISNVDDLVKISLSVYISNFPSHLTVRELWNICGKMGTLVDVYIAKRKNKLGQMFAFCHYIKVSNSKTLIDSLANTWIRKLRLHANVARFHRNTVDTTPRVAFVAKTHCADNMKGSYSVREDSGDHNLEIDLSHDGAIDFPFAVLGFYKDFRSLANSRALCRSEGFLEVDIKYLGGLWTLFYFHSLGARDKFHNHSGIHTWFL